MTEHDEFIEDLLKVLKAGEEPAHDQTENESESDKYPIHDPSTHWKVKNPMVCNYSSYFLFLKTYVLLII